MTTTTSIHDFIATTLDRTVTNPFDSHFVTFRDLSKSVTLIDDIAFWMRDADATTTYSEDGSSATITAEVHEFGCYLPMIDLEDLHDEDELDEMDDDERQSRYTSYLEQLAANQAEHLSEAIGIDLQPVEVIEKCWWNVLVLKPSSPVLHTIGG